MANIGAFCRPHRAKAAAGLGRREFLTFLSSATALPLAARAQQPAMPIVGSLSSLAPVQVAHLTATFRQSLNESGYVEGRNVAIEYRWAQGRYDQLPAMATDLVNRQVAVIVAWGPAAAKAAKAATATIPIIFSVGDDPVNIGLVTSLNRPGGNATGINLLTGTVVAKRLELLSKLVPAATVIAFLANPTSPSAEPDTKEAQAAARMLGRQLIVVQASTESEIKNAFAVMLQQHAGALLAGSDPFFTERRALLVSLAARYTIPAIYDFREIVEAGGLMSYGSSLADAYRQVGIYTGKVLKGAKPADLPVQQAVKVELIINLKTAKTLGLMLPPSLLALADEVIE
jgi:putative ABC transport system substrate-binding protein